MTPKAQSVLSYLGIFWLVAFFAGKEERNDFSRYHLKQGLGLLIIVFVFNLVAGIILFIVPALSVLVGLAVIIFLILMGLGIIATANEVKKPLPIVGKMFGEQFDFINQ